MTPVIIISALKIDCSDHAAGSFWSFRRKTLSKLENAKGCFGRNVVVRSIRAHMT